jgi:hypothetical protein
MPGGDEQPDQDTPEPLEAAQAGLAGIRERLEAAGRGEATAGEVKAALQGYLDVHGPTIKAAAASVGEEARSQVLAELYKWRAQIAAQLPNTKGPVPPPNDQQ